MASGDRMQFLGSFGGSGGSTVNLGSVFSIRESMMESRLSSYLVRSLTLITKAGDGIPNSGGLEASWR